MDVDQVVNPSSSHGSRASKLHWTSGTAVLTVMTPVGVRRVALPQFRVHAAGVSRRAVPIREHVRNGGRTDRPPAGAQVPLGGLAVDQDPPARCECHDPKLEKSSLFDLEGSDGPLFAWWWRGLHTLTERHRMMAQLEGRAKLAENDREEAIRTLNQGMIEIRANRERFAALEAEIPRPDKRTSSVRLRRACRSLVRGARELLDAHPAAPADLSPCTATHHRATARR